jgi:broad specificity phosphatase PhoE
MKYIWKNGLEGYQLKVAMLRRDKDGKRYASAEALSLWFFISIVLFVNCAIKDNQLSLASAPQHTALIDINSCELSEIPRDAKIKLPFPIKIATAADKIGPYTTFFIMRHAPTKNNHIIHGTKFDGEILTDSSKEKEDFIKLMGGVNFSHLYASDSMRAVSTASLINKPRYTKTWLFNEQKLGCLEGMRKDKAIKMIMSSDMFHSIDYRIPSGENGEEAETGREVTERMLFGIFRAAAENINKTVGICTSQGAMIWMYKYLSNNPSAFIKIKNYGIIIFRYYNETNAVELLTNNGSVPPEDAVEIYENSCSTDSVELNKTVLSQSFLAALRVTF